MYRIIDSLIFIGLAILVLAASMGPILRDDGIMLLKPTPSPSPIHSPTEESYD